MAADLAIKDSEFLVRYGNVCQRVDTDDKTSNMIGCGTSEVQGGELFLQSSNNVAAETRKDLELGCFWPATCAHMIYIYRYNIICDYI